MSRYIVTGCAGLIGSHVTQALLDQGHAVIGIDNLNSSYDERLKNWRVNRLKNHLTFDFHIADVRDSHRLKSIFTDDLDAVINLAAKAGVRQSLTEPLEYYETNVTGTINLLEMCRTFNIKKFILASTSSLYGDGTQQPFQETNDTNCPLSPYAASKKAAEAICYTYHHLYDIDITIPRYFTVYGPAGRPDMAIFKFIKWIAEGIPITLFGDGEQTRDFTYVSDIAQGTILSLKKLGYQVINLGSDKPISVNNCISLIEDSLQKPSKRNYLPSHPADVRHTWANISKAKDLLGWKPETDINTGINESVKWYIENQSWAKRIAVD